MLLSLDRISKLELNNSPQSPKFHFGKVGKFGSWKCSQLELLMDNRNCFYGFLCKTRVEFNKFLDIFYCVLKGVGSISIDIGLYY